MFDDRISNLQKMLARMGPEGRQRYAAEHADDPIAVSMALFVNNIAKEIKEGKRGEPEVQTPVVQQAIQAMNQPSMPPQGMPPQGQPQAPQQIQQQAPQQAQQAPQAMPPQAPQQQAPQQQAPQQQAPQQQRQTRMAADGGYMDSRLPEEMGIGALPERSLSNMADGGIVGYSFGGIPKGSRQPSFDNALEVEGITDPRQQAFLKALYGKESGSGADTTTSNRGAVGGMQILPGTFDGVADKDMDINNPFDNMRAGIRYGMQGYKAAKGDPVLAGAYYYSGPDGFKDAVNNIARVDTKNPKYPNSLEYGKSIAKTMTALLPMGSAQAAAPAAQAPAAQADLPSIYSGEGYTRAGLDALGERLDIIREARKNAKPPSLKDRQKDPEAPQRYDALVQLNKDAQKEYENYAEKLGLNKPAFAASAGDGKSVGATTIPFVQQVAKEAARPVSNEPDAYGPSPNEKMSFSDQMQEYGRGRKTAEALSEANRPPELKLTPEVKKEAVAEATKAIMASPEPDRLKGFGYEDLLMFGLQLMGNKSQYFGTAVGEAGVAALSAKQARTAAEKKTSMEERKIASDEKKEAAMAKYYDKYGSYLEAEGSRKALEDKPQLQYLKAVDAELGKLVAPNNMPYQIASPAEKQRMEQEVRDRVLRTYSAHFPELADTMGGGGFKVLGSRASP